MRLLVLFVIYCRNIINSLLSDRLLFHGWRWLVRIVATIYGSDGLAKTSEPGDDFGGVVAGAD